MVWDGLSPELCLEEPSLLSVSQAESLKGMEQPGQVRSDSSCANEGKLVNLLSPHWLMGHRWVRCFPKYFKFQTVLGRGVKCSPDSPASGTANTEGPLKITPNAKAEAVNQQLLSS